MTKKEEEEFIQIFGLVRRELGYFLVLFYFILIGWTVEIIGTRL